MSYIAAYGVDPSPSDVPGPPASGYQDAETYAQYNATGTGYNAGIGYNAETGSYGATNDGYGAVNAYTSNTALEDSERPRLTLEPLDVHVGIACTCL
jgi:hypothetical protein